MNGYTDYLGIDISKKTFDVVNKTGVHKEYDNTKRGFSKFKKTLKAENICVMEATGIYHLPLAKFLHSKNIALSVVNPIRIKRYSQMKLNRNKTDKSDAKMISSYAQTQKVELWEPSPELIEQGKDLVQIIEQYIEFRAGLKNKKDGLKSKNASKFLFDIVVNQIESISITIDELQAKLIQIVKEYDSKLLQNITSIVGIGKNTAALLILITDGFKNFDSAKQLSSFFGLAPTEYSSGSSINGSRKISKMGNPLIRKKLFMCSLQASRYNKSCIDLYQRLVAKGKPKKVALIAVVNKLLKISYAIAKSGLPYDREYKPYIVKR
ncbi:MAG: IS110 family transposase [Flavobacteriaceae bacterium]|nr:IS110 family transposase [Flavobacteriaceae bacterium]